MNVKEKRHESYKRHYAKHSREVISRTKKYYRENREKIKVRRRNAHLLEKFKISASDYDNMLREQGGGCAVCGSERKKNGSSLQVDHSHETGAIRGILCYRCNIGLGYFKDNIILLEKAKNYLQKYVIQPE